MFGLILSACLFWFLTVYFTQQHQIDWKGLAIRVILIHALAGLLFTIFDYMEIQQPFLLLFLVLLLLVGGLYLVLTMYVREKSQKKKWLIIGVYFAISTAFQQIF